MKDAKTTNRREFLKLGMTSMALLPLASIAYRTANAGDLPLIDEADPNAVKYGYVHDAADTDTSKFPKRSGDEGSKQFCYNCALYQGQGQEGQAACPLFQGVSVKAGGWCNAWAPRPQS